MKYIRTYENNNGPQIGDWVICKVEEHRDDYINTINDFVNNNIGKIIKVRQKNYLIQYDNIPDHLKKPFNYNYDEDDIFNSRFVRDSQILYFSPDKEHILFIQKVYRDTKKYNL